MLITVQPNPSWQLSLAQLSQSFFKLFQRTRAGGISITFNYFLLLRLLIEDWLSSALACFLFIRVKLVHLLMNEILYAGLHVTRL